MAVTIEQVAVALEKKGYHFRQLDAHHLVVSGQEDDLEMTFATDHREARNRVDPSLPVR